MPREPLTIIEIDMDRCTRVWGTLPCTAALAADVPRKCFNTFGTCRAKDAFLSAPYTLRFCEPRPNLPKGEILFPFLDRVSQITATVNIAGSDESLGPLGRTATVKARFRDAPHNGMNMDPYRAERISGAAQWGGVGVQPAGSYFGKLRATWPHYTGRPFRVLEGYIEAGAFVLEQARHFVITDWIGPDEDGTVEVEAKDPLSALADDRAVWPAASKGALAADMAATVGATGTLVPAGIGDAEYPASGRARIGSEILSYTRAADVLTTTARGLAGTTAATHSTGDTVQHVEFVDNERIDDFVYRVALTRLPASLLPKSTKWAPEISRWMPSVKLKTHIANPTGIAELLGSLAVLGVSIFWDDVAQEMALKPNRPPDGDTVYPLTERDHIKAISVEDRNGDRLTEIHFWTVQIDPTKSAKDKGNYRRVSVFPDLEAMDSNAFGDSRIRNVFCRWFDEGADGVISGLGKRLLARFKNAPRRFRLTVDPKDRTIPLAAVAELTTRQVQDAYGASLPVLAQMMSREPSGPGGDVEYVLQAFQFAGRYAYATENTRPVYGASSDAQRARGFYACDPVTLKMSNGDEPYRAI